MDTSLTKFKSDLLKYYFISLNVNYDPDNSRTFKVYVLNVIVFVLCYIEYYVAVEECEHVFSIMIVN